jgi:mRNA-degrading endonuclease RelE of RelBE toxin-antitoxin system
MSTRPASCSGSVRRRNSGHGGVRKLRFGSKGRGKSGGVRVIYYFFDEQNRLYALLLCGKNEQVEVDLMPVRNAK